MTVQIKFFAAALLAALLLVTVDITGRLWSPLQAADNNWQPVQLPVFMQPTAPAPALLQFFQVKAAVESAQDVPTTNLPRAADEQQIGDYRVSLFGIHSKAGVYRTVLSVEAKAQSAKPATYTLGDIAPGLTITHIDAKTVRLSAAGSQITLQLFNTQRSTAAQHQ